MGKKKRLEDIIPADIYNDITETANFLREIELIEKIEAEEFMEQSIGVREHLSALSDYKIDTSNILNQLSVYEECLHIKSTLESVICTKNFTYKAKRRGLFKYSYAETYYIARLAEELKRIQGKANYKILAEFLNRQGIQKHEEDLPLFCFRAKPLLFHIQEVLEVHKAYLKAETPLQKQPAGIAFL